MERRLSRAVFVELALPGRRLRRRKVRLLGQTRSFRRRLVRSVNLELAYLCLTNFVKRTSSLMAKRRLFAVGRQR